MMIKHQHTYSKGQSFLSGSELLGLDSNVAEVGSWAVWQIPALTSPDFGTTLLCHSHGPQRQVVRWDFLLLLQ